MALPRVIAVCGLKRSGKDTVADMLCSAYGYKKIKIAEGLKDMMRVVFGFSEDQLETDAKDQLDPRWGITPRLAMQFFGTEIMQYEIQKIMPDIGRTFWIKRMIEEHVERHPFERFVVSDMRFVHEYDMLKPYHPLVIRVERDEAAAAPCLSGMHVSEREFKSIPCSVIIKNNGTRNDLLAAVTGLFPPNHAPSNQT